VDGDDGWDVAAVDVPGLDLEVATLAAATDVAGNVVQVTPAGVRVATADGAVCMWPKEVEVAVSCAAVHTLQAPQHDGVTAAVAMAVDDELLLVVRAWAQALWAGWVVTSPPFGRTDGAL